MSELFLKKIPALLQEIGWSCNTEDPETLSMMFDMGEGRSQKVVFFYHTSGDAQLVAISSAVLQMDGLPDNQIGTEMAANLLRQNEEFAFANWAVDGEGEDAYLIATSRWWLDDLDKEELEASVLAVAKMADDMEKTLGVDNF